MNAAELKERQLAFEEAALTFWTSAMSFAAATVNPAVAAPDRRPEETISIHALQLGIVAMVRAAPGGLDSEAFSTGVGIACGVVASNLSPGMSVHMLRGMSEQFGLTLAQILEARAVRPTVTTPGNA